MVGKRGRGGRHLIHFLYPSQRQGPMIVSAATLSRYRGSGEGAGSNPPRVGVSGSQHLVGRRQCEPKGCRRFGPPVLALTIGQEPNQWVKR
jgi:hypothetical protein